MYAIAISLSVALPVLALGAASFFLWKKRRSQRKLIADSPFFRNEGNAFRIKELEARLQPFFRGVNNLIPSSFYKRTAKRDRSRVRGHKFEDIINEELKLFRGGEGFSKSLLVRREARLAKDSRVDFLLTWEISQNEKLVLLVECKHTANSKESERKENQIMRGKEQLLRYKERKQEANLLLLLTDFPLPRFERVCCIDGKIVLLNHKAFIPLIREIDNFIKEKYPMRKMITSKGQRRRARNRKRSQYYQNLLNYFLEKFGDETVFTLAIKPEEFTEALGVERDKYNVKGKFSPHLGKREFLLRNLDALRKIEKINIIFTESFEDADYIGFFQGSRQIPSKGQKRSS